MLLNLLNFPMSQKWTNGTRDNATDDGSTTENGLWQRRNDQTSFYEIKPGAGKKTGTTRYDYYDKEGNKLERTLEDKPKQVARKNLDTGKWEKEIHRLNKDGKRVRIW